MYSRAKEILREVPNTIIESDNGTKAIVEYVYKRDALFNVSDVYQNFMTLMDFKRGSAETFRNFESRFEGQVSKFNAHSDTSKIPTSPTALMLLANSNVDSGQPISVLDASTPTSDNNTKTTNEFFKTINYNSVAYVLQHMDRTGNNERESSTGLASALHNNTAYTTVHQACRKKQRRKKTQPCKTSQSKTKTECHICHK